jgi:hypothetical protein
MSFRRDDDNDDGAGRAQHDRWGNETNFRQFVGQLLVVLAEWERGKRMDDLALPEKVDIRDGSLHDHQWYPSRPTFMCVGQT